MKRGKVDLLVRAAELPGVEMLPVRLEPGRKFFGDLLVDDFNGGPIRGGEEAGIDFDARIHRNCAQVEVVGHSRFGSGGEPEADESTEDEEEEQKEKEYGAAALSGSA